MQLLVQQQVAVVKWTKQQGAHLAGLVQLQVQATKQLRGVVELSRRALVQALD